MSTLDLREPWQDLLRRRPTLTGSLTVYGGVIEHWAGMQVAVEHLSWSAEECRGRWSRGVPLLAEARPAFDLGTVEAVLSPMLDLLAGARPDTADALGRFADAWDQGAIGLAALFPERGRIGIIDEAIGLPADVVAFLAQSGLRPLLEPYFRPCRDCLRDHDWVLGICPFCGAPPGFSDVTEDGQRRLACHLCGSSWAFARLRCPFCGTDETKELARLDFEAPSDQGYFISTCSKCRAYLKELDRRVRWNGGPALVEDWGSPHFDMAAGAGGYWRPAPPVILPHPTAT